MSAQREFSFTVTVRRSSYEEACTVVSDRIHRCEEPLEDADSTPIEYQPTAAAR